MATNPSGQPEGKEGTAAGDGLGWGEHGTSRLAWLRFRRRIVRRIVLAPK